MEGYMMLSDVRNCDLCASDKTRGAVRRRPVKPTFDNAFGTVSSSLASGNRWDQRLHRMAGMRWNMPSLMDGNGLASQVDFSEASGLG
jgi:hypothetical protein